MQLKRTIVIFDTEASRAKDVQSALASDAGILDAALCVLSSEEDLRWALQHDRVDVLLIHIDSELENGEVVNLTRDIATINSGIQVVLLGVSEQDLPNINTSDFAALVPVSAGRDVLDGAIKKAFQLLDRWRDKPFLIHAHNCDRVVYPSKLSYVESNRRKVRLHVGDEVIEAYGKISQIMSGLPNRFVQCHKSFVVNMGFVQAFNKEYLILTTGERVPVSQKRRRSTRDAFYAYVGRIL